MGDFHLSLSKRHYSGKYSHTNILNDSALAGLICKMLAEKLDLQHDFSEEAESYLQQMLEEVMQEMTDDKILQARKLHRYEKLKQDIEGE